MSAGPPADYPPPPPAGGTAPPPARRGFFDQFKGLQWWEILLVVLPLGMVAVGGLLGGVVGALGLIANLAVAHSKLSTVVRVLAMIGVLVASYLVWLIAVVLIAAAFRSGS